MTDRDGHRACFCHAGPSAAFLQACRVRWALVGANVVDARKLHHQRRLGDRCNSGYRTPTAKPLDVSRLPRLRQIDSPKTLQRVKFWARDASEIARQGEKTRKGVHRSRRISTFDNDVVRNLHDHRGSTNPRPSRALLYDLTRSLSESTVYIANAVDRDLWRNRWSIPSM